MRKSQQSLLSDSAARLGLAEAGAGSESYSSNSSFTDSYSNSSDLANWEEFVAEDGSLFYAEYLPHPPQDSVAPEKRVEFTRSSSLRLGKKARRQQQQQQQKQQTQKSQKQPQEEQQKPEFLLTNIKANENIKQMDLVITAADRFRFGRRSTAVESILGFRVVPFSDQPECLMVDSFVHDMPAMQSPDEAPVKRGDWFKSLDDIEIRTSNVDDLLLQFTEPTKVTLKFQGPPETSEDEGAAGKSGEDNDLQKITSFDGFADVFQKLHFGADEDKADKNLPFSMLIIPPNCYQQDEHKDSMFYYPKDNDNNFLYKARGSFLTLNSVLTDEMKTKPMLSKLTVAEVEYFVIYRSLNGFLVLFAYCGLFQPEKECTLRTDELMIYLQFAFPSLTVENLANGNARAVGLHKFLTSLCQVQTTRIRAAHKKDQWQFEELLKESRYMPLPKEAQLRIFDALSEMEAMDYRNWNDEPLNTHREFFIHGSVLYYDHFMLASQMPVETRANIESFLRCRGIFDFTAGNSVKELYIWEEIAMPDASGRFFLTICSRSHLILTVILKIFDAPDLPPDAVIPPSLFYIEEIQETLDHLIQCGIESLAKFWSVSNKRPELSEKLPPSDADNNAEKDSSKLETFIKQKLSTSSSPAAASTSHSAQRSTAHDDEAHLCSSLGGSSIHSQTPSEDDSGKKRTTTVNVDDSDSGSDWEGFTEQNPLHYGDFEGQAQMTESLWKEINSVVPANISPGVRNSLYYYIYVDNSSGTIFCPTKVNNEHFPFMKEMRMACHTIHDVLRNSSLLRELQELEATQETGQKMPYKEYGMTMVVREKPKEPGTLGAVRGRFTVAGRLFTSPSREVYICHHPDIPENLLEVAFRLAFLSVG